MVDAFGVCAWTHVFLAFWGTNVKFSGLGTNRNQLIVQLFLFPDNGPHVNRHVIAGSYHFLIQESAIANAFNYPCHGLTGCHLGEYGDEVFRQNRR